MNRVRSMFTIAAAGLLGLASVATADLILEGPTPGTAGTINSWSVSGAAPRAMVGFVWGAEEGSFEVPSCPGVSLSIARPLLFGITRANGNGEASIRRFVPQFSEGHTLYFQAIDQDCQVSNLVEHTFD